jgi:hypothetical protein
MEHPGSCRGPQLVRSATPRTRDPARGFERADFEEPEVRDCCRGIANGGGGIQLAALAALASLLVDASRLLGCRSSRTPLARSFVARRGFEREDSEDRTRPDSRSDLNYGGGGIHGAARPWPPLAALAPARTHSARSCVARVGSNARTPSTRKSGTAVVVLLTEGVGFEPTRAFARRFSRPVH